MLTLVDDRVAAALAEAAARAAEHDARADGSFPAAAWAALAELPAATAAAGAGGALPATEELALVRAVGRADVSLGRLLDGHFNAVQRLAVQVDPALAEAELAGVRAGRLRLGVWGADPGPGEGAPAELDADGPGARLSGVKVFCSGAGGLQRAFVLVRGPGERAPSRMAYVDLTGPSTVIDRDWFAGAGMRGSASHRVVFSGAPVLWLAPEPGALLAEPWFSGDAIRTAASWAGGLDAAVASALEILRGKPSGDVEALAVGRMRTAQQTVDLWLAEAGRRLDTAGGDAGAPPVVIAAPSADRAFAAHLRDAIDQAVRTVLDEASRACGSRAFATGGALERARRDLQTYVLQHRLDPIVMRAGHAALAEQP